MTTNLIPDDLPLPGILNRNQPTTARHGRSKQIAANLRNAQKSAGPGTAHGKAVSKMNALKHSSSKSKLKIQPRLSIVLLEPTDG